MLLPFITLIFQFLFEVYDTPTLYISLFRYGDVIRENEQVKQQHREDFDHRVEQGEATGPYVPIVTTFDLVVR